MLKDVNAKQNGDWPHTGQLMIVLCAIVLFAAFSHQTFAQSPSSPIDPRAQKVIDHTRSLEGKPSYHDDWQNTNGPWAAYLAESYSDHLNNTEKEAYQQALDNFDCDKMQDLQAVAFLRKHPYLRAAHQKLDIANAFKRSVINKLPDHRHCQLWDRLNRVLKFIKVKKLKVPPIDLPAILKARQSSYRIFALNGKEPMQTRKYKEPTQKDRAFNSLCSAIHSFVYEAVNHDNRLAVASILRLAKQPRLVKFTEPQLYYIYLRAQQLNSLSPDRAIELGVLHHRLDTKTRHLIEWKIENPKRTNSIDGLDGPICNYPRISVRDWLELF